MRIFRVVVCFLAIAGWAHAPKVFDCFPFFNEFEVLKIRLDELSDVVDYFVLIESVETQRGRTKSLYFEDFLLGCRRYDLCHARQYVAWLLRYL